MSTTSEKLRGLVETLYKRTEQGKIEWNLSADRREVWSDVSKFRIEVTAESSENFGQDIRITLYNNSGDQVDTFTDSYFSGMIPSIVNINSYFSLMVTLLEMAKRQASGADAAIENILETLGGTPVSDHNASAGFGGDFDEDVPF